MKLLKMWLGIADFMFFNSESSFNCPELLIKKPLLWKPKSLNENKYTLMFENIVLNLVVDLNADGISTRLINFYNRYTVKFVVCFIVDQN